MCFPRQIISCLPAALLLLTACARIPPPPTATPPTADDVRHAVRALRELHREHRYRDLVNRVVAGHSRPVAQFLTAVDEFELANEKLCHWVRDQAGAGLAQTIDQSYLLDDLGLYAGDDLGVFSRNVELLDVSFDGDQATLAYTATDRLPARRVHLQRLAGAWRLAPASPVPESVSAAFRDWADALTHVRTHLERGGLTAAEIHDDPARLMELVQARMRRGVTLLSQARGAGL